MFYAKKGNKVLRLTEAQIDRYANDGFTIYEDDKIIKHGKGATVSMDDYLKVVEENKKLKAELNAKNKPTEVEDTTEEEKPKRKKK